jgi:putative acetyltransferase
VLVAMTVIIRDETGRDHEAVRRVHRLAFAGEAEVLLVDALRRSGDSAIALVAEQAERVVGHVLLSRLEAPMRALALAPVGVLPEHQGQGIGSALVRAALKRAQGEGWAAVFVLGEPAFYRRFGFSIEAARGYSCLYAGEFFMVRALVPDPLPTTGRIDYPPPFGELE